MVVPALPVGQGDTVQGHQSGNDQGRGSSRSGGQGRQRQQHMDRGDGLVTADKAKGEVDGDAEAEQHQGQQGIGQPLQGWKAPAPRQANRKIAAALLRSHRANLSHLGRVRNTANSPTSKPAKATSSKKR